MHQTSKLSQQIHTRQIKKIQTYFSTKIPTSFKFFTIKQLYFDIISVRTMPLGSLRFYIKPIPQKSVFQIFLYKNMLSIQFLQTFSSSIQTVILILAKFVKIKFFGQYAQ